MAKFLNTSATNYFLEELIKAAKDRLILISPFLKLNDRIKELLEDKNRLKIDVRIVYGKSELQPNEINWLKKSASYLALTCTNSAKSTTMKWAYWSIELTMPMSTKTRTKKHNGSSVS